jgi:lipopolysaccharide export system ATP-binding protein
MNDAAIIDRETAAATGTGTGLSVVSIAKSYDKRTVLSDVSLTVGRGEVVGLLGPNGAGKTTCFYSIMGLVKPDAGRIELDGQDITDLPMYRRAIMGLGYLPQETSIFRGLTVEQNIQAVLELAEPDKSARAARLEQLLDEFGLTRLRASAAMALSGGERRRCEIARALAAQPQLIILDEPTEGIQPSIIKDIGRVIRMLASEGLNGQRVAVLLVEQYYDFAEELADHYLVMERGEVIARGPGNQMRVKGIRQLVAI